MEDMLEGYTDKLTIDREDNNGNYCKENCRWVTQAVNCRNQRKHKSNTSGINGVSYEEQTDKRNNSTSYRFRAWWCENNKVYSKSFSTNKFGYDEAFRLACEYRAKMLEKLNEQGAGYSPTHGL